MKKSDQSSSEFCNKYFGEKKSAKCMGSVNVHMPEIKVVDVKKVICANEMRGANIEMVLILMLN